MTAPAPTTKFTRRTRARLGAALVVVVVALAGCATDNTPQAYDTITQQNFVELCTNFLYSSTGEITDTESAASATTLDPALSATDSTIAPDTVAPDQSTCLCMYGVFVDQMSIADFTTLNKDMKSNPDEAWSTLPASITDGLTACGSATGGSTTTSTTTATGAESTTTTAAAS